MADQPLQNPNAQLVTLLAPVHAADSRIPLVIQTCTPRANGDQYGGGPAAQGEVWSEFILLKALPDELRERVITAIKMQLPQ